MILFHIHLGHFKILLTYMCGLFQYPSAVHVLSLHLIISVLNDLFLYVGHLSCDSWRYRLQNIFPRSWEHSKPWYHLSSWWLLLPYILWYIGQITVCFTSAILVYIYTSLEFFCRFILKCVLWCIWMYSYQTWEHSSSWRQFA
jgi:small-conductance mechanosensitive channel